MRVVPTLRNLVAAADALSHLNTAVTFPPDQAMEMHVFLNACLQRLELAKHFVKISWLRVQAEAKPEVEHNVDINRMLNTHVTDLPAIPELDALNRSTICQIGHHLTDLQWLWPESLDLIQPPFIPDSWLPSNAPQEIVDTDLSAAFDLTRRHGPISAG